jgi:hypothetical protein
MNMKHITDCLKTRQVEFRIDSLGSLVSFKDYSIYIGKAFTVLKDINGTVIFRTVTRCMTDEEIIFFNMQHGRDLLTRKEFMKKLVEVLNR